MQAFAARAQCGILVTMIIQLRGTVGHIAATWCVVEAQGIGYKVHAAPTTLFALTEGAEALLWVYHVVREDTQELFGFATQDERSFFELLISVPGIGPRSALGLLALTDVPTLASAIAGGDASALTRVSGIGKKTAEKLVVTLRDKVAPFASKTDAHDDTDVIEALMGMGFSAAQARQAVKDIPADIEGVSNRLKAALAQNKT